ncbi:LpxD N-terminal domain-containing protein [Haloplanus sp. GCM10025708]|uniref:LpxD N-terminal domain-containing protein n=1 Tax=Haloferacaceae TaxID=1644056 RepID=UPI0036106892
MAYEPIQKSEVSYDSEFLAQYVSGEHCGKNRLVTNINSLDRADEGDLTFCAYDDVEYLSNSSASVIITDPDKPDVADKTLIKVENPKITFWKLVDELFIAEVTESIVHSTAVVEDGATVGNGCIIGPHTFIGDNVTVGDRCRIQAGTSIGGEGFGYVRDEPGPYYKQIHKGGVVIEDDVEIGSNCSIDRSFFGDTIIGAGTKLDNLVHIAHRVTVGEHCWLAYGVGISGAVDVGSNVRIHPNAAVSMRTSIGDRAVVAMNSGVLDDVEPDTTVVGTPAQPVD